MSRSTDGITMARGLALLYAVGATLVALAVVLPHREGEASTWLLLPAGLAFLTAPVLFAGAGRFTPGLLSLLLAVGTSLVSVGVYLGGPAGGVYAFMYVWVALY